MRSCSSWLRRLRVEVGEPDLEGRELLFLELERDILYGLRRALAGTDFKGRRRLRTS